MSQFAQYGFYNDLNKLKKISRFGTIIAITGGIGVGKSFIARYFEKYGFFLVNLDNFAHKLLEKGSLAYKAIVEKFPQCCDHNMVIDKDLLAQEIFNNPKKLSLINRITHPIIQEQYQSIIANINRRRSIIAEIPLLIEAIIEEQYCYQADFIILVTASYQIRLQRVMTRNYMTPEKFDAIVGSQLSDSARISRADFVIQNENLLSVLNQIGKIAHAICKRNSS